VVPVVNYFQAALVLFEDGRLEMPSVVRVVLEMVDRYGYDYWALRNSIDDLFRRGRVRRSTSETLAATLTTEGIPQLGARPPAREILLALAAHLRTTREVASIALPTAGPIDYLAALEVDLPRKRRR
jgi:hypothetical protein